MGRKRPSLRNYLVEGDQVREICTPENPPLADVSFSSQVESLLTLCPTETLDIAMWGTAMACLLLGYKDGDGGAEEAALAEAFPLESGVDLKKRLDRMVEIGVLERVGEKLGVTPPSRWNSISWVDDLMERLSPGDREMWRPVVSVAKLAPLSLDRLKEVFDASDLSSDQFFIMRKKGDPLLPATRPSQIRMPLETVILWSEKGDSTVFFDVSPLDKNP